MRNLIVDDKTGCILNADTAPTFNFLTSFYLLDEVSQLTTRAINHLCSQGPETITLITNTGKQLEPFTFAMVFFQERLTFLPLWWKN